MLDNKFLQELSRRLSAIMPMAEELSGEVRTKIEQQLKKSFADLDLLSREEFEGQARTLERAQQRIAELESQLSQLESRLDQINGRSSDE